MGRSRKPKFIEFHFTHKKYIPNIITYKEHAAEVKENEVSANNRFQVQHYSHDDAELYLSLLAKYEYDDICYNTNKYLHLAELLIDAGYKVQLSHNKIKSNTTIEDREDTKERRKEAFDIESSKKHRSLLLSWI